ncbi:TAXI family TRAP transporter solute-binding subunit [Moritella sp.]|uniref:TAXI family TRAP transporter solute-binding subunit n=1 Tax=Moritella sp. TaxID=78556 RepID=UPI0025E94C94|nr:TAXI family TRAP transporter solute-binding subunit [Moritella sp.]MCJ8352357.1 hypothetical protein [Moritella sp.]
MKKLYLTCCRVGVLMGAIASLSFANIAMAEGAIKLCTGSEGGAYHFAGERIAEKAKNIDIELVVDTGGTMANIELALDGDCDAFIGQQDGISKLKRSDKNAAFKLKRVALLHKEYAHFICNKESGIDAITDIEGNAEYSIDLISDSSGGAVTWANFVAEDDGYAAVKKVYSEDAYTAASNVASGETTCMLLVSGIGSGAIGEIDTDMGSDLILANATDKDFNDALDTKGKPLYEFDEISKTYEVNLQTGFWASVETVSMRAAVYINKTKIKGKDLKQFIRAVNKAKDVIRSEFDR